MPASAVQDHFSVDRVFEDVRLEITQIVDPAEIVRKLAYALGRRGVARLTHTSDPSTVSRWITGRAAPHAQTLQRIREGYCVYETMRRYFGSDTAAEQWLTGASARFDYGMPLDALADSRLRDVIAAMKADIIQ
ncbi:XRE family transcriptional regulator [bacterium]|nr:MAG: XRE family transcriptional regulator [bacterium]